MRSADWYAGAVFDALEGFECEMFVEDPEDPQQDAINAEAWDVVKPLVERIQAEALAEGRRQMAEEVVGWCQSHVSSVADEVSEWLEETALAAKPGGEGA